MKKAAVLLADGFEEIEAVTVIDILRRSGIAVQTVSVMGRMDVLGAHGIKVQADILFDNFDEGSDILILPGGGDGTANLGAHEGVCSLLTQYNSSKKWIAAICAAPTVLDANGVLDGKEAVCYPSCEPILKNARVKQDAVCVCDNVITSRGPGTSAEFAFKIVELILDAKTADSLKGQMLY